MRRRLTARLREVRGNLLSLAIAAVIASQLPGHLAGEPPKAPGVILMSHSKPATTTSRPISVIKSPRDLLARCPSTARVAALLDAAGDGGGGCGLIVAPDGESFLLGTREFRICRDAIMTEWLPAIPTDRREAVDQFQLEASLACQDLPSRQAGS